MLSKFEQMRASKEKLDRLVDEYRALGDKRVGVSVFANGNGVNYYRFKRGLEARLNKDRH